MSSTYTEKYLCTFVCLRSIFVAMCYMSTQNKHLHVQVIKTTFANLEDITNISCSGGSRGGARGAPAPAEI